MFLGDLCDPDSPNLIRCIRRMQYFVNRLSHDGGIGSWLLAGNHDVLEDGHGTTVLDPIGSDAGVMASPMAIQPFEPGPKFAFLPYVPIAMAYDPEEVVRGWHREGFVPDLIAGHLMLDGISAGSETEDFPRGRDVFFPIDLCRELFPDAIMIAGHYHRRQVYRGVHVVGSLVNLTRAEAGNEPGFLEIEI